MLQHCYQICRNPCPRSDVFIIFQTIIAASNTKACSGMLMPMARHCTPKAGAVSKCVLGHTPSSPSNSQFTSFFCSKYQSWILSLVMGRRNTSPFFSVLVMSSAWAALAEDGFATRTSLHAEVLSAAALVNVSAVSADMVVAQRHPASPPQQTITTTLGIQF